MADVLIICKTQKIRLFVSNLLATKEEDRKFITSIYKKQADEYLVANLQDKWHAGKDNLSEFNKNDTALQINATKLTSNLKPIENKVLMKAIRNMKEVSKKHAWYQ